TLDAGAGSGAASLCLPPICQRPADLPGQQLLTAGEPYSAGAAGARVRPASSSGLRAEVEDGRDAQHDERDADGHRAERVTSISESRSYLHDGNFSEDSFYEVKPHHKIPFDQEMAYEG